MPRKEGMPNSKLNPLKQSRKMNLDSQNIVDHLLELQSNIHAFTAMEQYYSSQKTKELDDLKEKYISYFQALLKEADKLTLIDNFNSLSKEMREGYLISDTRKFFSDLNSKIIWLVHHVKTEPELLTKLMQFADLENQETKRQLAASLVTFYLTDPASDKPKLYEVLARMPIFIKELFAKPGFQLDSLFSNKSFVIILMKQFLKTPEARHSVRQIFKEVLSKIDFEELQNLELDFAKVEAKVLAHSNRSSRDSEEERKSSVTSRSSGASPTSKRSSSELIMGNFSLSPASTVLSPRKLYRGELLRQQSEDQIFQKQMFRQQIQSRKSVAIGVSKKQHPYVPPPRDQETFLPSFREPSLSQKQKLKYQIDAIIKNNTKQLAQIVQMMIAGICHQISAVPFHIRASCKILCNEIDQKFQNKFTLDRNSIVFEYLFSKWWIPSLANPVAYGLLGRNYLTQRSSQVFIDVIKVINKIAKGEFFDPEDKLFPMNDVIETEIEVMNEYLKKLISVQDIKAIEKEDKSTKPFQIKVACLSLQDVKSFYSIILKNLNTFKEINPTCESIIKAIEYKEINYGVFSQEKLDEFFKDYPEHIKMSHKYFLFFDFEEIKQKPQIQHSKDNQKESAASKLFGELEPIRKESSQIFQKEQQDQKFEIQRSSTVGDVRRVREVNGVLLLMDPIFKEKLVKCFDMLLKSTTYLKEVKFYSQDQSRISMVDILNFIDDREAIERAEENYEMKLACLFIRNLFRRGQQEQEQINQKLTEIILQLSAHKCEELEEVKTKLFAGLSQFNSMSLLIIHHKRTIQKNVKHLEQINVQQRVESVLTRYELELCISREKLEGKKKRIVFEDPNKCHHMRMKAPITNSLIGFAAPEPQMPRKKTKAHVSKIDEYDD